MNTKKILLIVYCALILVPCVFFSLGVLLPGAANTVDGAEMPSVVEKGNSIIINTKIGTQFEEYFAKNFAYRNNVVDAFSTVKENIFSDGNEQVVVGKDDFLFFADTLDSYTGANAMTDTEINAAADSLLALYKYSRENGASFLFVCAPNKNSIYGEMMPSRYTMQTENRDLDRLYAALDERFVPYLDLRDILIEAKSEQLIYHKRDTHWNTEGARIAAEAIAAELGFTLPDFSKLGPVSNRSFEGDLDKLLYPASVRYDDNTSYNLEGLYGFASAYSNPMQMSIRTRSNQSGKLLMFRDSFANAMFPLLATGFGEARFERSYTIEQLSTYGADAVIVEIAERNIRELIGCDERIPDANN